MTNAIPKVTIDKAVWVPSTAFCIECGKQLVWVSVDYNMDYNSGDYYVCLNCGTGFHIPFMHDNDDMRDKIKEKLK